ncbi:hypothetical protein PV04_00405 [Phialophora macrospora]|uniref:Uncharacterized protein n=1 Tax=Phialophora macrospora TaxID=1851006 RepID=A0A0D2D3R7_9EURO|nr:hypothetical protein PV04_00405 [Phialophora macrospora]
MTECILESRAACLPVTALASIQVDGSAWVVAGQGPYLHIYNGDNIRVSSTRIFEIQPVLGVKVLDNGTSPAALRRLDLVVWGGALLRLGSVTLEKLAVDLLHTILCLRLAEQRTCSDWILSATFLPGFVLLLTAHNRLLGIPVSCIAVEESPRRDRIWTIDGPESFLYSGCLSTANPDLVIVASGTVFGEILVWTCRRSEDGRQWVPSLRHVFRGHKGSVFGVSISEAVDLAGTHKRLLASCSDDRTVRIWDISDCDRNDHNEGYCEIISTETGFGPVNHTSKTHIASAWGHLSRIWDVEFVTTRTYNSGHSIVLLSRGEDGACQMWTAELRADPNDETGLTASLGPAASDRLHFGKNAWSMCQLNDEHGILVYTGGADGQIISRRFVTPETVNVSSLTIAVPFKDITKSLALKNYLLLNHQECLAITDQGHLFRLTFGDGKLQWRQLQGAPVKGGLTLCSAEESGFVLAASQRGGLYALLKGQETLLPISCNLSHGISWLKIAGQQLSSCRDPVTCVVAVLTDKTPVILWLNMKENSIWASQTALRMPETFTITACYYDQTSEILLLGSRAGALAAYSGVTPESATSQEPYCLRHVHGTESVSSISVVRPDADMGTGIEAIYILTTGRDGNYALHRLESPSLASGVQPQMFIVHLSPSPFGLNTEGAYFAASEDSISTHQLRRRDLILFGFRSTSFIVWNETQQSELLSVECGGPHRSWAFRDESASAVCNTAKSFVWTKAGKFNWHNSNGSSHGLIQRGFHGREIKAVARSPLPYVGTGKEQEDRVLVATGAEDTNIQLFAIAKSPASTISLATGQPQADVSPEFQSLATLKRHTTGLQHLQFSPSGHYLFSSAGCEEFYVWQLSLHVPRISLGVVLWDVLPTEEEDSDARIMAFDLRLENAGAEPERYTLVLAYSNGKSKILRYTTSSMRSKGTFETLQQISYGSFCVMQALFLPPLSGPATNQTCVLSAGTNGYVNLSLLNCRDNLSHSGATSWPVLPRMEVHKLHQSSILAMDVMPVGSGGRLIATGGDDNALGLTLLTSSAKPSLNHEDGKLEKEGIDHRFRTILIPSAHAAAVTALKIVCLRSTSTTWSAWIITVANDQRVKIWRTEINLQEALVDSSEHSKANVLFEALQVELVGQAWTGVADVSGIEIIDEHTQHVSGAQDNSIHATGRTCRIMVLGVGMGLMDITSEQDEQVQARSQPVETF